MTRNSEPTSLLILGESGTGKTHYGAQLLLRLNSQGGALRMRAAASNMTPFEAALRRLSEGRAAGHTATADYLESLWPVADGRGRAMDLVWPDYGGEQIRRMLEHRRVSVAWRDRLMRGAGWILLVRVQHADLSEDLFSRPLASLGAAPATDRPYRMSDQSRLVELLQLLLHVRGVGTLVPIASPALTVLLSCWDELGPAGAGRPPAGVLAERLPLLADFVETNWRPDRLSILGLSSLGRPLQDREQDEEYIDRGPEHFGFIVRADGSLNPDLTLPIAELFARTG